MTGRLFPPLLAAACLCGGCANSGDFPSLAPRPVEKLSFDEPSREAASLASDPALVARVEAMVARARAGQADFDALSGEAEAAVSRGGGGAGSESWVVAQQALSRLQAARRETVAALADLDALALERADQPVSMDDRRAILSATEIVAGLARAQQQRIDALKARLSPA